MRPVALLLTAALLLPLAAPAQAAQPRANLADLEGEVMCPVCGTLLELAEAPQAQRQRILISKLIATGMTREEIKEELVAEYGREVLAMPRASGFDLTAYLVPAIAFAAAVAGLGLGLRRWRKGGGGPGGKATARAPRGEEAERLEADLARYDL